MREVARTCCMLASIGHLMRKLSPHPHTSSLAHPRCCAFCALLAQEVAVSHHASFVLLLSSSILKDWCAYPREAHMQ